MILKRCYFLCQSSNLMSTISLSPNWCNKFVYALIVYPQRLESHKGIYRGYKEYKAESAAFEATHPAYARRMQCDKCHLRKCFFFFISKLLGKDMPAYMKGAHSSGKCWHQRPAQVFCGQIVQRTGHYTPVLHTHTHPPQPVWISL